MIINFNFFDNMICELQIKLGDGTLPRGYEDQHFIYEVKRCLKSKSTFMLQDVLVTRIKKLCYSGSITFDRALTDLHSDYGRNTKYLQIAMEQ